MSITEKDILKALSNVEDPDLKKDIVTLEMVRDVEIKDKSIFFSVYLTTPACPMKEMIEKACINAIKLLVSSEYAININMTSNVSSSRPKSDTLPGVKNIIAVGSGKGGVGKSTVASYLAKALQTMGAQTGLLDADIYGPSIPKMFNAENLTPKNTMANGKEAIEPIMVDGIKLMSIGFMVKPEDALVWRGPMVSSVIRQFINDVNWGDLDYLIIDLPPGTGDVQLTLTQYLPITGIVIVTTPQAVATADALKAINMFKMPSVSIPIIGIAENMSWFIPPDMPEKKYKLFHGDGGRILSEQTNVPLIGQLPFIPDISKVTDSNILASSNEILKIFNEFAKEIARLVSIQNTKQTA